jgi:hypothetical protein
MPGPGCLDDAKIAVLPCRLRTVGECLRQSIACCSGIYVTGLQGTSAEVGVGVGYQHPHLLSQLRIFL